MPKRKQTARSTNGKPPLLVFVGVILLLVGLWVFAIEPLLDWRDKQRFVAAEEYLEEVYEEYIAPSGNVINTSSIQYCDRTDQKFDAESFGCTVKKVVEMNNSQNENERVYGELSSISLDDSENFQNLSELDEYSVRQNISNSVNMRCSIDYTFNENGTRAELICSDDARDAHFKIR